MSELEILRKAIEAERVWGKGRVETAPALRIF